MVNKADFGASVTFLCWREIFDFLVAVRLRTDSQTTSATKQMNELIRVNDICDSSDVDRLSVARLSRSSSSTAQKAKRASHRGNI